MGARYEPKTKQGWASMGLATDMCGRFTFQDENTDIDETAAEALDLTKNRLKFDGICVRHVAPSRLDQTDRPAAVTDSYPKSG